MTDKRLSTNVLKALFQLILLFSCTSLVAASSVSVEMTADTTVVSLEDEVILKVVVSGEKSTKEPVILNHDGFSIESKGTSSSMSIINGHITSEIIYSYSLVPEREGRFTIGPAKVRIKNKEYTSDTVTLNVKKSSRARGTQKRTIYITAEVNRMTPYVNEQIVYTFRLLSRVRIMNARATLPEFEGFWKDEMGKQRDYQKIINGQQWNVTELQYALFPLKSGEITIKEAKLTGDVVVHSPRRSRSRDPFFDDPFFNRNTQVKRRDLRSDPINLSVRALPKQGKPDNFTDLVGQFTLKAELSKKEIQVGDTTTLKVTIEGNGNVRNALLPDTDNDENFKAYDDNPSFELSVRNGCVFGSKTFTRALVPLTDGSVSISGLAIPYFNPLDETYHNAQVSGLALQVLPREEKEESNYLASSSQEDTKKEIKVLGRDLMPIYMKLDALDSQTMTTRDFSLSLALALVPGFMFCTALIYRKREEKLKADSGIIRKKKALKKSQASLKELDTLEGQQFYDRASHILRTFLGDKLNIDGSALTSDDIRHHLESLSLSSDTKEKMYAFTRELEAALYSGQFLEKEQKRELSSQLVQLLETFAKEMKV